MSDKKHIAWITQGATLDTDIYVWEPLSEHYEIDAFILRTDRDPIDYDLGSIKRNNVNVSVVYLPGRAWDKKRPHVYWELLDKISNYDAIYMIISGQPFLIPFAALRLDKSRTIIGIHNVHILKGGIHPFAAKIYRNLALREFELFDTFSESQRNLLEQMKPNKKVFLTRLMLRDYGDADGVEQDTVVTFLAYGNIRRYKRFDVLIDAAQLLKDKGYDNFKVIIAGKCDCWNAYQKRIRHPELFELHIERIKNEDIPVLFSRSHYVVMPYQDIAQSGVSLVAINYKRPLIVSKLDAFEEFINDGENGYFIKPADVYDLAEKMGRCLNTSKEKYIDMVNEMEKTKKMYSKENILLEYMDMFKYVLNGVLE